MDYSLFDFGFGWLLVIGYLGVEWELVWIGWLLWLGIYHIKSYIILIILNRLFILNDCLQLDLSDFVLVMVLWVGYLLALAWILISLDTCKKTHCVVESSVSEERKDDIKLDDFLLIACFRFILGVFCWLFIGFGGFGVAFVLWFFVWGNRWILIDLFWGFGGIGGFCRKKCRLWGKGVGRGLGEGF